MRRMYGIPEKLIKLVENIYSRRMSVVRVDKKLIEWCRMTVGMRQGCTISPDLFNLVLEAVVALRDEREESCYEGGQ